MRFDYAVSTLLLLASVTASPIDGQSDLCKRRGGGGRSSGHNHSGGIRAQSHNSNAGGLSSKGSGPQPSLVSGRYYPGGAEVPYRTGRKTSSGTPPFFQPANALNFWPGQWYYGAYIYPFKTQYRYYNTSSREDEIRGVLCGCSCFAVCGCDDNNSTEYYSQLIGNGSWSHLNKSIVNVGNVNGTITILINGTLPNGTTLRRDGSAAGGSMQTLAENLSFWSSMVAALTIIFVA